MKYRDIVGPDFPYKEPSFLSGFASALDLFGGLRGQRNSFSPATDATALARDWEKIGSDLQCAMDQAESR